MVCVWVTLWQDVLLIIICDPQLKLAAIDEQVEKKLQNKNYVELGMVLQKAMKQGRNIYVHGIPPRDACSDVSYNIKGVWPHWGACPLRFCVQLHPL